MLKETLLASTFPTQIDEEAKTNESDENLLKMLKYSDVKPPSAQTSFQLMVCQTWPTTLSFLLLYLKGE